MNRPLVTTLILFALFLPLVIQAADPPRDAEPQKQLWQQRMREAIQAVAAARARYEEAQATASRLRHSNRDRGERRKDSRAEVEAAREALEEAEQRLEALPEEARRAGVPPGWLREVEDEEPAAPSP